MTEITTDVRFDLPFKAIGKGRPRFFRGHAVTPQKTRDYELAVSHVAKAAMRGRLPLPGPVLLTLDIDIAVPRSWPKYRRIKALAGGILPTVKPDFDNAAKAIADAMNCIVYQDDTQIVTATINKRYASDDAVRVTVRQLDGECAWEPSQIINRQSFTCSRRTARCIGARLPTSATSSTRASTPPCVR